MGVSCETEYLYAWVRSISYYWYHILGGVRGFVSKTQVGTKRVRVISFIGSVMAISLDVSLRSSDFNWHGDPGYIGEDDLGNKSRYFYGAYGLVLGNLAPRARSY